MISPVSFYSLINWQTLKCGASGFLTGLGGFVGASVNAVACKAIGKGAAKLLTAA